MKKLDNSELRINYIIDKFDYIMRLNPNIIGMGWGNKIIKGKMTNIPTLTIFVERKYPKAYLDRQSIIPNMLHGALTDIVEIEQPKLFENDQEDGGGNVKPKPTPPPRPSKPTPPTPTKPTLPPRPTKPPTKPPDEKPTPDPDPKEEPSKEEDTSKEDTKPTPKPTPKPINVEPRKGIESRPAYGGQAIGGLHDYSSGSIGYLVTESSKSENYYALTSLHVLDYTMEAIPDKIKVLQPPKNKQGTLRNSSYGTFEKGIPIKVQTDNTSDIKIINEVDAAIVKLGPKSRETSEQYLRPALNDPAHLTVTGIQDVYPGSSMWKVSSGTGITNGVIQQTNVKMDVKFYKSGVLPFKNQIIAELFCNYEDAGTLGLISQQVNGQWKSNAFGLLLTPLEGQGANAGKKYGMFNKIDTVLNSLQIKFVTKEQ